MAESACEGSLIRHRSFVNYEHLLPFSSSTLLTHMNLSDSAQCVPLSTMCCCMARTPRPLRPHTPSSERFPLMRSSCPHKSLAAPWQTSWRRGALADCGGHAQLAQWTTTCNMIISSRLKSL
jgi:hypothetical protein